MNDQHSPNDPQDGGQNSFLAGIGSFFGRLIATLIIIVVVKVVVKAIFLAGSM